MQLILYVTTSDKNEVNKSLSQVATFSNVHPIEPVDVEAPSFTLGSASFEQLRTCNYAYVPELHRYYYLEPATLANHGNVVVSLREDVLMSFADSIRSLTALVSRQENNFNLYLPDPEFKVYANTDKKTLKFSNVPFTKTPNFLLTVSGGA